MSKNKIRILVIVIIVLLLLVPIPAKMRDGGSVEYTAIVYSITRYNRFCEALGEDGLPTSFKLNGWRIKILGFTLYDDDERLREEHDKHYIEMCEYYGFT